MSRGNGGAKTAARKSDSQSEKSKSLTDQAYDQLRKEIITCKLAPGTDLGEQELAEKLQMSKTPVREALARGELPGMKKADSPKKGGQKTGGTGKKDGKSSRSASANKKRRRR